MATQQYAPQQYMPAAPPVAQRPAKFVPSAGTRHVVTVGAIPGRMVPSTFGASEVVFDVDGGRPWYVPQVVADEIYRLGVRGGDQIEVTVTGKKKSDLLIVPVQSRMQSAPTPPPPPPPPAYRQAPAAPADPEPSNVGPAAACMCAAMCAAVDAVIETQKYATRKGLGLTFGEESVRAIGLSIYINSCKGGAR